MTDQSPIDAEEVVEVGASYEFDNAFQSKIASIFSRDTSFAKRVASLIEPSYFTDAGVAEYVRICKDHLRQFGNVPDRVVFVHLLRDLVNNKRIRDDLVQGVKDAFINSLSADLTNQDFIAQEVETFARHQAVQNAMMESIPLLEKGQFDKIRDLMAAATQVGMNSKFERYNYFEEVKARTEKRDLIASGAVVRNGISTGYPQLDVHLYHGGWGRKELSCLMGAAKSGKSLALGDFAKNASLNGHNVLYVSLEVAKEILAERIDAALSDTLMAELVQDRAKVESVIASLHARAGVFEIIDFPSGTLKPSQLHGVLEQYRDQGIVFDMVVVDYADIMAPENRNQDLRDALREIYIDLRALAHVWNVALLTATQTNREGAKAATAKATDVGDDWNKARTVDILIGLNATDAEKQAGEMRLFWALSRNTRDGFSVLIKQDRARMKFLTQVLGVQ